MYMGVCGQFFQIFYRQTCDKNVKKDFIKYKGVKNNLNLQNRTKYKIQQITRTMIEKSDLENPCLL